MNPQSTTPTYTIAPGDTLNSIASKYGTTIQNLQSLNPSITDPNLIKAGATLNVPQGTPQTANNSQPPQGSTIQPSKTGSQPQQSQPVDYNAAQKQFQSSIQSSGADVNNAAAVRQAVSGSSQTATAFPNSSLGTGTASNLYPAPTSNDPNDPSYQTAQQIQQGLTQMENLGQQWNNYLQSEGNLQDYFNTLVGSTAGPTGQSYNDLSKQLLDINNVMRMSEDDIRNEVQRSGGVADESQIQALTGARNRILELKAQNISDQLNLQSNYVNQMMQYHQADQQTAEQKFSTAFDIQGKILDWQKSVYDTQFNQSLRYQQLIDSQSSKAFSMLDQMSKSGVVPTKEQAEWYANIFNEAGIPTTPSDVVKMTKNNADLAAQKANMAALNAQAKYYSVLTAQARTNPTLGDLQPYANTTSGGVTYVDLSAAPKANEPFLANLATQNGFKVILDKNKANDLSNITDAQSKITDMINYISPYLPQNWMTRAGGAGARNSLQSYLQQDKSGAALAAFSSFQDAGLDILKAISGVQGFRGNQTAINQVQQNLPQITDTLQTAQQKVAVIQRLIQDRQDAILGSTSPSALLPTVTGSSNFSSNFGAANFGPGSLGSGSLNTYRPDI